MVYSPLLRTSKESMPFPDKVAASIKQNMCTSALWLTIPYIAIFCPRGCLHALQEGVLNDVNFGFIWRTKLVKGGSLVFK